jgi:hypothetical protein
MDEQNGNQKSLEERARERVEELKGFYIHFGVFVVIQLMLVAINLLTTPYSLWVIWPLMGWGVGLASHAVATFGLFGIGGRNWEERKMQELMIQMGKRVDESDIRLMLDEELDSRISEGQDNISLQRMIHRLENLEAIVTSREWDLLDEVEAERSLSNHSLDLPEQDADAATRAARLSKRVR